MAIIGLLGVGLIHLIDSIGKYSETRYLFWMYIALIVGTIVVSGALLHRESRLAWTGAGLLAASALVGYVLSRTTGLPSAKGDIGNWTEPIGLASLFVEGCLVALAGYRLAAGPSLLHLKGEATRHPSFSGRTARVSIEQ